MLKDGGQGGGSGGQWIDKEDRERMRQSLGMMKGVLGERRRWWDALDPWWLTEEEGEAEEVGVKVEREMGLGDGEEEGERN